MSIIRRQDPIVYAQIDVTKRMPCLQPLSPPHPAQLQQMHHPHMPAYMTHPMLDEQQHLMHESAVNAETPLITQRDCTVSM